MLHIDCFNEWSCLSNRCFRNKTYCKSIHEKKHAAQLIPNFPKLQVISFKAVLPQVAKSFVKILQ